jgi:hypothetical protein
LSENSHFTAGADRPNHAIARPRMVASVLLGALAVSLVAGCGSGSDSSSTTTTPGAVAATPAGLRTLAKSLRQPIYWVGPAAHMTYERRVLGSGRVLVSYLPSGAKVGTPTPLRTVATYTLPNAYAATQFAAGKAGAIRIPLSSSAIAFTTKTHPLNAWITYPGSHYQIEVFDPVPGRARQLIQSGRVARVPGSPKENRPSEVSPKSLARVAANAQKPIYWAGPLPDRTYELTKTDQGFLVRYLPLGTPIGAPAPYLTVGTYAVKNAMAAVRRLSLARGATKLALTGGGLAVFDPRFPKSIYLAFPASNYELEVFAPSRAEARQLVATDQIVPVS